MLFKKNRKPFRLRIDRKQAERERKIFESEPEEVKANLKVCKVFMVTFIPLGAVLSFLPNILTSIPIFFVLAAASSIVVKLKTRSGWKMPLVPVVCLVFGFLSGQFILKNLIATILR